MWFFILYLLSSNTLWAQSILYSPDMNNTAATRFEVIGKTKNYYWIQKSKAIRSHQKSNMLESSGTEYSFEIFDARLNQVNQIASRISVMVLKEYLISGDLYFDQLLFTTSPDKTRVVLNRYSQDGHLVSFDNLLLDFPYSMKGDAFLLIRSEDKSKILLLGFEPVEDQPPRIHAILYNADWQVLCKTIYNSCKVAQPFIQYDFTNNPLEHFENSPVKLANTGEWLMLAPSRYSNTYMLCHFYNIDSIGVQSEINQAQGPAVQNVSLSLDITNGQALAGFLINTSNSEKKVRIVRYALSDCLLNFDTTYKFSTTTLDKNKEKYIFEQSFVPLPGKGFLFLKEYGRTYYSPSFKNDFMADDEDEANMQVVYQRVFVQFKKDDYTYFKGLYGVRRDFERGDLSLYYFPATSRDSCWSGIINKAQTTELNAPYLSYVCMTVQGRIIFLYNSLSNTKSKYSSTTILDQQGNLLDEGLVFWRRNSILDFQKARQISATELAVPYEKNRLQGFVIIRL